MKQDSNRLASRILKILAEVTTVIIIVNIFFFLPVYAEEMVTSTEPVIDIVTTTTTSTPEIEIEATTTTESLPTSEETKTVTLNIRYNDQMIFSGSVPLSAVTYTDTINQQSYDLNGTSTVFSTLVTADKLSDNFAITDAQYNQNYGSFYVRCLMILSTSTCDNWNYVVNNAYPIFGMDKYELAGGETIYIYFSNSWQITATTSTFPLGATTTLQTWRYQYDNLNEPWVSDPNDLIDIAVPNPAPAGWWDTTITVTTTRSNDTGIVDYLASTTGTFYAKIISNDYSKWSWPITLSILEAVAAATTTVTTTQNIGNNGNSAPLISTISQNEITNTATKILTYLKSQQDSSGKIIDGNISDWSIISFGADDQYAVDIKKDTSTLLDFAKNYNFTDPSDLNPCATYPRHILALLAGGVSETDTLIQNLVAKTKGMDCYANSAFGQNGINDDVFALLALLALNTPINETIMTDLVTTIKNDQTTAGAFTWAGFAGADITGAAMNSLKYAQTKGVSIDDTVFMKAKSYLKTEQLADGGWGFGASDALTTSWAVMGINALGESQTLWANSQGKNPWHVLVNTLNPNGYYESNWAPGTVEWFGTKHAVPALLGKSWPIILPPKPNPPSANLNNSGGGSYTSANPVAETPSSTVTSTIDVNIATSTPQTATTTLTDIMSTEITSLSTTTTTEKMTVISPTTIKTNKSTTSPRPTVNSIKPISQKAVSTELESNLQNLPQNQVIITSPPANPVRKTAQGVFTGAATLSSGLGLYLAWRFLQSLV